MHKKGVTEEVAKKRTRRNQKPEVREAARKEHIAKTKEAKKARQTERKANRQAAGANTAVARQQAKSTARSGGGLKA